MERYTQVNGWTIWEKDMAINCGLMVHATKESGTTIRQTELANLYTQMATSTKGNGWTIKLTAREHTLMLMVLITMAIGLMINNMGLVWKLGLMVQNTRVNTKTVRNMEPENLHLLTEVTMRETSGKTRFVE
jgi:hypothetical protein